MAGEEPYQQGTASGGRSKRMCPADDILAAPARLAALQRTAPLDAAAEEHRRYCRDLARWKLDTEHRARHGVSSVMRDEHGGGLVRLDIGCSSPSLASRGGHRVWR